MPANFDLTRASAETVTALRTYAASCRATAVAAVPADRPAAEGAVTELYERARLPRPRFVWVASPVAAAVAESLVGYPYHDARRAPSYRHVGIDPERLRPTQAWTSEVRRWMGDQPADDPRWHRPRRPMAELLGLDALRASLRIVAGSGTLAELADPTEAPDPRSGATAIGDAEWSIRSAGLPGSVVDGFLRNIGSQLCADVRTASGGQSRWLANASPWMLGQFDPLSPYVATAHEVLGRRVTAETRDHLSPFVALARSSGPWVALDGVAILSERATSRSDVEGGTFLLTYRDGLAITGVAGGVA